jgi:hypothetical protein
MKLVELFIMYFTEPMRTFNEGGEKFLYTF